jgi:hypothetical protein
MKSLGLGLFAKAGKTTAWPASASLLFAFLVQARSAMTYPPAAGLVLTFAVPPT